MDVSYIPKNARRYDIYVDIRKEGSLVMICYTRYKSLLGKLIYDLKKQFPGQQFTIKAVKRSRFKNMSDWCSPEFVIK